MATKLYLPSTGTAKKTPTPAAGWTDTSQFTRYPCDKTKASSAMATVSSSDANDLQGDIILGQWVSKALDAGQTITGAQTVTCQIRCSETNNGNNLVLTWYVYVLSKDGTTVNKTLNPRSPDYRWEDKPFGLRNLHGGKLYNCGGRPHRDRGGIVGQPGKRPEPQRLHPHRRQLRQRPGGH